MCNIGITVDGIVLNKERDKVVLIKRGNEPYKGMWALPGGFVDYGEPLSDAVRREIKEETNLDVKTEKQLRVRDDPLRDSRGHIISIPYICVTEDKLIKAGDDAVEAKFFDLEDLLSIDYAFDHGSILIEAVPKLLRIGPKTNYNKQMEKINNILNKHR